MKSIIIVFAFILSSIYTTNAQTETFNLTVNIAGLNSDDGTILIAVYNKKESFLRKGFKNDRIPIKDKKAAVTFKDLPKGEYAVSFVHDENNNKKMDTNFLGIPKEDYGCSNNATGFMGPPKYDDAKFMITENKTINIKI